MQTIKLYELRKNQTEFERKKLTTSKGAYDFIMQFYGDDIEIYESCFILLLDMAQKTIGYAKISQGGVSGTIVDPKIIAKYAVDSLASGLILAHNHPSGNLNPSEADNKLTQKIKSGLLLLDIQVYDHIIMTKDGYYSYADEGAL